MCEIDGDLFLIIGNKSRSARHRDVENPRDDRRTVPSHQPYPRSSLNSMASLLGIRRNFATAEITCAERDRLQNGPTDSKVRDVRR